VCVCVRLVVCVRVCERVRIEMQNITKNWMHKKEQETCLSLASLDKFRRNRASINQKALIKMCVRVRVLMTRQRRARFMDMYEPDRRFHLMNATKKHTNGAGRVLVELVRSSRLTFRPRQQWTALLVFLFVVFQFRLIDSKQTGLSLSLSLSLSLCLALVLVRSNRH
jgi:hypothetical protein